MRTRADNWASIAWLLQPEEEAALVAHAQRDVLSLMHDSCAMDLGFPDGPRTEISDTIRDALADTPNMREAVDLLREIMWPGTSMLPPRFRLIATLDRRVLVHADAIGRFP